MESSTREPTRESEVSISPAKIAKLADPRDYLLPGASHTDLIETDQFGSSTSVLEVEVASERSDCEVVDSLDCIDEREIRSLADTKNHTPQEKNKDLVTKRDVEAVHSYDTILKHIPPNARNRSVRRADAFFHKSVVNIIFLYESYRSGDQRYSGDDCEDDDYEDGDCDCCCHRGHGYCWKCGDSPDRCLPGRDYCENCREEHRGEQDPHTFEDVEAELNCMLSKVEMYLKDSKSLAALVLLEAVFIVAVTEPVGPKDYTHYEDDDYGDESLKFMKGFFKRSISLLLKIFCRPNSDVLTSIQKACLRRIFNAILWSPYDNRQFLALKIVAHVRPWQDPLLCQVISGQMFGDELLEAKPVVQQRLDALEAENRFVEALNYIDGVTIDLEDCPGAIPEDNCELINRGAAYLFRLNRYADGLWRLFYGHTGDHPYAARKGRNAEILKFAALLKAVCGEVVSAECLPNWAGCLCQWSNREKSSISAAKETVCKFISYAFHAGLIPNPLKILTCLIELTAKETIGIPTYEANVEKFRSYAMKIVDAGFDADLELTPPECGWNSGAIQLQVLLILVCKLIARKELDRFPGEVDKMLHAFKENVWAIAYIANSSQLEEQPSNAVISWLCRTYFPKYGMVDVRHQSIESWYKKLSFKISYIVTKNLLQQAFKGQPIVAKDPVPSHLDKDKVLKWAEVLLQAAVAPQPIRYDRELLAFLQYLYKEIFLTVEIVANVSFFHLIVKLYFTFCQSTFEALENLRQFYGHTEWAEEEQRLINKVVSNATSYPENIPAVAETVACLGRWPELLSLLNQVGFARSDSTRNCCGDAVVEKLKGVAGKMRLNQHAPFLQVVEVWLKERAVIEPKSETGLKALLLVEPLLCVIGKISGDKVCSVLSNVLQTIQMHCSTITLHEREKKSVLDWLKTARRLLCNCGLEDHFVRMRLSVLQGPLKKKGCFMRDFKRDPVIMSAVSSATGGSVHS